MNTPLNFKGETPEQAANRLAGELFAERARNAKLVELIKNTMFLLPGHPDDPIEQALVKELRAVAFPRAALEGSEKPNTKVHTCPVCGSTKSSYSGPECPNCGSTL